MSSAICPAGAWSMATPELSGLFLPNFVTVGRAAFERMAQRSQLAFALSGVHVLRLLHQVGPQGIALNVAVHRQKMVVLLHWKGFETALVDWTCPAL